MDNVKFCKKCGKVIVDGEKFCANCGAPVDDETTENTTSGGTPTTYKYVGTKTPKKITIPVMMSLVLSWVS